MTLTELSAQVGITVVNLSVLKNGRAKAIRFSTLSRICETLGCRPGELITHESAEPAWYRSPAGPRWRAPCPGRGRRGRRRSRRAASGRGR
ncbi:helix-turn-helix domain-containing protein [Streptomyces sp. SID11233]|nr:helix-turn-helix domain-containing protein [Streptomyces sp. SID11233]